MVLSDYAKGALTPHVIRSILEAAKKAGKPTIVDPKINDLAVYRGASMITPNRKELADAVRRHLAGDADIESAAAELGRLVQSEAVLVTRSDEGMTLVPARGEPVHVPAYSVKVRDVSGAGDTVAAVLATMLAAKSGFESAMRAANAAAAVVVGKRGTATASLAELRSRILPAASRASEEKIVFDWAVLDEHLTEWRRQGLRIGFTNGCFDLLHPGHVRLLGEARAACDRLIVGLNSDHSVTRLKGQGRPVQDQQARGDVLAALEAVDLVVVFEQDTPQKLIERVRPNVLGQGQRLRAQPGSRPRDRGSRRRRDHSGRYRAGVFDQRDRRALARIRQALIVEKAIDRGRHLPTRARDALGPRILPDARSGVFCRGRRERARALARNPGIWKRPAGPAFLLSRNPSSPKSCGTRVAPMSLPLRAPRRRMRAVRCRCTLRGRYQRLIGIGCRLALCPRQSFKYR